MSDTENPNIDNTDTNIISNEDANIDTENTEVGNISEVNAGKENAEEIVEVAVESESSSNDVNTANAYTGKISPALKKELGHIFIYVLIGVCILILAFLLINLFTGIPVYLKFDYTVILGAVFGGGVAFLNFFLMGLTVQKVASDTNKERAASRMKMSYTYRYLMQIAWIVIAILVPCFNSVAGIVPLLFPTMGIKIAAIIFKKY